MRTPFTSKTQSFYTRQGVKICTYKDAPFYNVVCLLPDGTDKAMATTKRDEALYLLSHYTAFYGGKKE